VGTLPLLAAFLDNPCEPSPYSPMSRLFWNEFYLDVTKIPEFAACPAAQKLVGSAKFQSQIAQLRASELVDYRAEMALKRKVLELLADLFFSRDDERRGEFERFVAENPEVSPYAEFRAVCEARQKTWQEWPQRLQDGELRETDFAPAVRDYHLYAQWSVQQQVEQVVARCCERGVNFYLDFPLGVNPAGYDGWRYREQFAEGVSAGAPPDAFFTKGQNWGFAPLDPQRMRVNGYGYLLQVMRFQMRHTGMLRIDHVMGLHRLYWVPQGMAASEGAYVNYPAEELNALLCLESVRNETTLVGENLGTVPPEVNRSMDRHGLRKMFVLQYELRPKASAPVSAPARNTVASLNTHDMPTFAAFWEGLDIKERGEMGLLEGEELGRENRTRTKVKRALVAFLQRKGFLKVREPKFDEVLEALLKFLGTSNAESVLVTLEDLWAERSPQNVPGTSTERPNWRRKSRLALENFNEDSRVLEFLKTVDSARKQQHQLPK
jgi:4-alpha-glucanotransferase